MEAWRGELNKTFKFRLLTLYLLYLCRCFGLIESSTLEQTREETETEKMTHLESLVELGLSSTFSTILTQCSKEIFKVRRTWAFHLILRGLIFCCE